jgi:twitching motility protein PilT
MVLRGIFAQHLLPPATPGARRVPCGELLVATTAIANLIATDRDAQIYAAIENGRKLGMQTLDQDLARLCAEGRISERTAFAMSRNPDLLRGWIRSARGAEPPA